MSKINWKNHLLEFLTVLLSIWIAFALNNWSEQEKEKKQAALFLHSIQDEINTNLKEVSQKYEYHLEILDGLHQQPLQTKLIIRASRTEDFAWQMANNNIFKQRTDFEIYRKLSKLYSSQDVLKQHNKQAGEMMAFLNVNSSSTMIELYGKDIDQATLDEFRAFRRQGWIPIFEDMVSYEKDLIDQYQETLEAMEAY